MRCDQSALLNWGLRDYGTGTWTGGDSNCQHSLPSEPKYDLGSDGKPGRNCTNWDSRHGYKLVCGKCGARRIDRQLGSEARPDCGQLVEVEPGLFRRSNCADVDWQTGCYICRMVLVFREVRRVMRDDATLWLNMGDSYASGSGETGRNDGGRPFGRRPETTLNSVQDSVRANRRIKVKVGLPSGNLVGVPWRLALALQADGWILRSDIPWCKRSAMPESCQNRPAKALEYVFMFAKKAGYYFDMEAVRRVGSGSHSRGENRTVIPDRKDNDRVLLESSINGRNFRNADLWFESVDKPHGLCGIGDELVGLDVTAQGYAGAHFATFGCALVGPFVKCGTSERGCCEKCGKPWRRVVDSRPNYGPGGYEAAVRRGDGRKGLDDSDNRQGWPWATLETETLGWRPDCECWEVYCKGCCTVLESSKGGLYNHAKKQKRGTSKDWVAACMRVVRGNLPESSNVGRKEHKVLFEEVQRCLVGKKQKDDYGKSKNEEGVRSSPQAGAPRCEGGRVYYGAPPCNGGSPGEEAQGYGDSPPQERNQRRQPPGKLGGHGEVKTRPDAEASEEGSPTKVPLLQEEVVLDYKCQSCEGEVVCRPPKVVPQTVLDPFCGSGTVSVVCLDHGRHSIGIDLSEKYLRENAVPRIESALFSRPALVHLAAREAKPVLLGKPMAKAQGLTALLAVVS